MQNTPTNLERANFHAQRRKRSNKGFTLIEIVVAVGIVATVFVAFMGMLPLGMSTMKEANSITTQARIAQKLIGEMQLSGWRTGSTGGSGIRNFDRTERYLDEYGNETENKSDAIYLSSVALSPNSNDSRNLPGSSPNDFLMQVEVKVVYAPAGKVIDFEDDEDKSISKYVALVVDLEMRDSDLQ